MRRVLTYGRFDNLSRGHIEFLKKAGVLGDYLIVALTTDESVAENGRRPCRQPYDERKRAMLAQKEVNIDEILPEYHISDRRDYIIKNNIQVLALGQQDKVFGQAVRDICEVRHISSGLVDIPMLVIVTGQACTLRCRDCGNFSPYAPAETKFYSAEKIINDLQIILDNCSSVAVLQIQGGEPFLHPKLDKIIEFALCQSKIGRISIATNGTLLPNVHCEAMVSLLKNEKICVRVSNYQTVESIKERCQSFKDFLTAESICYKVFNFAGGIAMWSQLGPISTSREENVNIVSKRYDACAFRGCLTLENSILGYCSRSVIAIKVQGLRYNTGDYLIIENTGDFHKKLNDYVLSRHFMESCRYCYGSAGELIEPARQLA